MRRTHGTVSVARALLADPSSQHYGWELSRAARVRSATMYRILSRMLEAGWLTDGWEDPAAINGRPPRRYYQVTEDGRVGLEAMATD